MEIERKSTAEIKAFQETLLQNQLRYLADHSPYYQRIFKKYHVDLERIKSIEDLQTLPTTTKNDLQQYNDDFFCVPRSKIIDYCATSGTLGSPVTFGLTDGDLDRLAYNEWRSFELIGVRQDDLVQLMTTIDRRFMAGLAYFLGLRKIGAGILRIGSGIPEMQWDAILKYKPKYLIAVPSFLLKLIEYAEKNNIDYRNSSVQKVLCIGESLSDWQFNPSMLHKRIVDKWPLQLYSTYASTEMGAAFTACEYAQGGHVQPDLIITEVLDDLDRPVADGERGELVITNLGIEGVPLLRFKTGDLVRKHTSACACGRHTYRIGPVEGRKQHMVKYKGTTLYPPAMHDLLAGFPEVQLHLIELSDNEIGTDEIVIYIASSNQSEEFLMDIKDHFRAKLRVAPRIELKKLEDLQKIVFNPLSRKPITFVDYRK